MKRNRFVLLVGVTFASLVCPDPTLGDDIAAIEGTWSMVSVDSRGRAVPTEILKDIRMVITAATITRIQKGIPDQPVTYKLDPTKTPKWIDQQSASKLFLGIYELQGDDLKICMNRGEAARATAFVSKDGTENNVFMVLKRAAPLTK